MKNPNTGRVVLDEVAKKMSESAWAHTAEELADFYKSARVITTTPTPYPPSSKPH